MNFGAGMGAGMGAGIGTGFAIGASAVRTRVCQQIREYVQSNAITIQDSTGTEIDIESLLSRATADHSSLSQPGKVMPLVLALLGVAGFGLLCYLIFF